MKRCGLLGEKLGHSYSPAIHAELADYEYRLYEVAPEKLGEFLTGGGFDGMNVTIPYKKAVIPYCAELSPIAQKLQSVNVLVRREDGTLYGDNADAYGFAGMVRASGIQIDGKKTLVLGSGGASSTVCAVLEEMGARSVTIISRKGEGMDHPAGLENHKYATWDLPVENQQESTYGPYFVAKMKEFLQDIKTLNLLATEKGIIATSTDMEKIRTVAHDFYDGLSAEDMAFMGDCTLDDVISIYTEYFVACKTSEYLISDVDSEVSDADAKIIRVQEIVVSDELLAEQLLQQVNVPGANFSYYARQNSEDPNIEKTLAKSEKEDAIYQAAFALEEGQISDIIEQDGKYYILKCIDAYDEAATLERKKKLEETIRSNALLKQYTAYADEHIVRFREPFWKEIDLTAHPESDADNFFSLFDENISF